MTDHNPSRFSVPLPTPEERLEVFVAKPIEGGQRWRVGWRLFDELGRLDHGHISSHESLASARIKKGQVIAWMGQRAAEGIAETEVPHA